MSDNKFVWDKDYIPELIPAPITSTSKFYSPDQERDYHGRFAPEGGAGSSSNQPSEAKLSPSQESLDKALIAKVESIGQPLTNDDVKHEMESRHPGLTWDFSSGQQSDMGIDIAYSFEKLADQFPEVAAGIAYVGDNPIGLRKHVGPLDSTDRLTQAANLVKGFEPMKSTTMAWHAYDLKNHISVIEFNPSYTMVPKYFEETVEENKKKGWFPHVTTIGAAAVFEHEFGHAVYSNLVAKTNQAFTPTVRASGFGLIPDTLIMWVKSNNIVLKKPISEYAKASIHENFAENFSAAISGTPGEKRKVTVQNMTNFLTYVAKATPIPEGKWQWQKSLSSGKEKMAAMKTAQFYANSMGVTDI